MPDAILDPTGRAGPGAGLVLAPRPAHLRGVTVGLLDNTKQNAARYLREVGRLLVERHGAAGFVLRTKTAFALPVPDDLRDELTKECDVIITGVGDCGSCSASAVADAVAFERRGTPAAVICSDAFRTTADAMAGLQGAPGYRYATTPHPVAVLTPDEVRERALRSLPDLIAILLDRHGAGGP
jgi:hypothetical protein